MFHRLFGVVAVFLAAATIAVSVAAAGGTHLEKLVLRAAQIGPGYRLHERPDGHGANGFVTLDMCGYLFTSENDRTARLQVDYGRPGAAVSYSNEVVTYAPGGTRLALKELNDAVQHCPRGPVPSGVQGTPPITYRLTRISAAGLLPGAVALRVNARGVYKGKPFNETDAAIYQVHGNVLSGLYAYGGSLKERENGALHAARQSRANLTD